MPTIHISTLDILGAAIACDAHFKPLSTPRISGSDLIVTASKTVSLPLGSGSIDLEPGNYEVIFLGIKGNADKLTIGVPDSAATYSLTQLIDAGVTPPNPPGPFVQFTDAATAEQVAEGVANDVFITPEALAAAGVSGVDQVARDAAANAQADATQAIQGAATASEVAQTAQGAADDALSAAESAQQSADGKLAPDGNGSLLTGITASQVSGIPTPKLVTVADATARYALPDVNIGDIVEQADTQHRWLVCDLLGLDSDFGYQDLGQKPQYIFARGVETLNESYMAVGGNFTLQPNGDVTIDTPETVTEILFQGTTATSIDARGLPILEQLDCQGNQLTELLVAGLGELLLLNCSGNQLTELDITGNPLLGFLGAAANQLASVDDIIITLNANGLEGGRLELDSGTNAAPTEASASALANLVDILGWTIITNSSAE